MDKISVIVPVYNAEKYLDQCIKSILNQTYQNLELVLVNDGSTDSSFSICRKYAELNKNIRLINQQNVGHSEARNTGLRYATGSMLSFVDDDDYVEKNYLKNLFDQMQKYKSNIAVTSYYRYDEGRHSFAFLNYKNVSKFEGIYSGYEWLLKRENFENIAGAFVSPWCKLYTRSIWNGIWFPHDRKLSEDNRTAWKLFLRSKKVSFEPHFDYCWRKHGEELSSAVDKNNTFKIYKQFEIEQIKAMEEEIALLSTLGKDISVFRSDYKDLVNSAVTHARQFGDFEEYEQLRFRQSLLQKNDQQHFN